MTDKPYMTHDLGARNDPKLVEAERASRGLYKAIWWDLAEMVWENGGYLPMNFDNLAYLLRYPTPEEVRAVVMDFDLFVNDGEQFWNNSALARIQHKQEVSAQNAANRRGKGALQVAQKTDEERTMNGRKTNDEGTIDNKLINKLINKNNLSARTRARDEEEEKRIFEIFFFRNFADPVGEVDRFFDFYYNDGSWKNSNGRRISNIQNTALEWRPEKTTERFPAGFLAWYKAVYAENKTQGEPVEGMLTGLDKVGSTGKGWTIIFNSAKLMKAFVEFVNGNGLKCEREIKCTVKK